MSTLAKGLAIGNVLSADGSSIALSPAQVANIVALGAKTVRLELRLGGAHPTWDDTITSLYQQVVATLGRAGVSVIGLVDSTAVSGSSQAQWNANNAENGGSGLGNPFVDSFLQALARVAAALPQIALWEVWNEPNSYATRSGTTFMGGSYIYPSLYAVVLQRAYALLKALYPNVPVSTGGLFGHTIGGVVSRTNSGATYLDSVLSVLAARGAGGSAGPPWPFDAAAQHLYIDQGGPLIAGHITTYLSYLASALSEHQAPATRLLVTEVGWKLSAGVTTAVQASNVAAAYAEMATTAALTDACWFGLDDTTNPTWGLYADAATIKPAGAAYQALAPGGTP